MRIWKRFGVLLLSLVIACAAVLFAACSPDTENGADNGTSGTQPEDPGTQPGDPEQPEEPGDPEDPEDPETPITIELSQTSASVNVGQSVTFTARVKGSNREVRWFASSGLYFELDADNEKCTVTGIEGGKATVTAYVSDVSASAEVTVIEKELTADYDLTADGDLSDWEEAGLLEHSIGVQGQTAADSYKSATFYGVLEKDGLYLAAEVYHDVLENTVTDFATWWHNSQFEFFVGGSDPTHYFVYASAQSDTGYMLGRESANTTDFQAVMKTETLGGEGQAQYKTVVEVYLPANKLPAAQNAAIRVGVAWKSMDSADPEAVFDTITGGEASGGAANKYWVPKGAWTDNSDMPYVTENGIYLRRDYEAQN